MCVIISTGNTTFCKIPHDWNRRSSIFSPSVSIVTKGVGKVVIIVNTPVQCAPFVLEDQ